MYLWVCAAADTFTCNIFLKSMMETIAHKNNNSKLKKLLRGPEYYGSPQYAYRIGCEGSGRSSSNNSKRNSHNSERNGRSSRNGNSKPQTVLVLVLTVAAEVQNIATFSYNGTSSHMT